MRVCRASVIRAMAPLLVALAALIGCARVPVTVTADALRDVTDGFFVLQFDTSGRLNNPDEVARLAQRLQRGDVTRIKVWSYGWNIDLNNYTRQLSAVSAFSEARAERGIPSPPPGEVTVYAMWDSSSHSVRRLLTDITPFPTLAQAIGTVPDLALFPLTFWPKAGLATRIAHGDLHDALEQALTIAYASDEEVPSIHLFGRSFGGRMVTSLASAFALDTLEGRPANGHLTIADHIEGMLLIQPAMSGADLRVARRHHDIPTVVTFSRHDRANGVMFPPAAVLASTTWHEILPPLRYEVPVEERTALSNAWWGTRKALHETGVTLLSATTNVLLIPGSYLWGQIHRFATEPVNHTMDTLAVLPIVQIPVMAWDDHIRDPESRIPNWGDQSKGLFSLGSRFDSVGRGQPMFTLTYIDSLGDEFQRWSEHARPAPTIHEVLAWDSLPEDRTIDGVLYVDCTDSVNRTKSGWDMNRSLSRATWNHLTVMGAHEDMFPDELDRDDPNRANVLLLDWWLMETDLRPESTVEAD